MKTHKLSGACVVIAVLVAMAVAASAHANARSSTAPAVSTILAPPSLDPLTSAEVAATARQGVPLPRAREAIAVQGAVERNDLVSKLEAALGDAFGGVWYVPAAARLDVGVTSPEAARIAEAVAVRAGLGLQVTEILVRWSEAELVAVQERFNGRLVGLFARKEVTTRTSVEDNSVYVELGSEVPAGEQAALEGEASEAPVSVVVTVAPGPLGARKLAQCRAFVTEKAYCDPTIVAGTTLDGTAHNGQVARCTTGPAVFSPAEPTETYVLTAGHCVIDGEGEIFYSYNKAKTKVEIGPVAAFVNSKADVAAIKVENKFWKQNGDIPVIPTIAAWDATKETDPFKVKGETTPVAGAKTCGSGQKTGNECGTITNANATDPYGNEHMVEVQGTTYDKGDSGGPWFSGVGEKWVEGTLVSRFGQSVFFQPLWRSFEQLKPKLELKLLTEANQTRLHEGATAFTCVKGTGATEPFKDAHCDEKVSTNQGYKHEEIKPGAGTLIDLTNEKTSHETKVTTPGILRGTTGGVTFEIQCTNFTGKSTIENKEIEKRMQNEGTKGSGEFTNCTVIRPENAAEERHPCKVKEGKVVLTEGGTSITKENLGAGKNEMGVELKPPAGKPFITFEFEGANCALKGTKIEVTGTAVATGNAGSDAATTQSGATLKFTTAMTSETLKVGASVAEFSAVFTPTMYNEATKTTENPIALTTTAT